MTRPSVSRQPSTQLKLPVVDDSIEGLKIENAHLMRRLLMLTHSDVKLRSSLELATGVPWDQDNIIDLHGDELEEHIAKLYSHGMGVPLDISRQRIAHHRRLANKSQGENPGSSLARDPSIKREIPTIKGKPAK